MPDEGPHPLAGMKVTAALLRDAGWPEPVRAGDPVPPGVSEFLRRRYDEGWRPESSTPDTLR
jgi:hypothetical protein